MIPQAELMLDGFHSWVLDRVKQLAKLERLRGNLDPVVSNELLNQPIKFLLVFTQIMGDVKEGFGWYKPCA